MVLNELEYINNLRASGDVIFLGDTAAPSRVSWVPVPDGSGFMAINDARPDEGAANFSFIGTISRNLCSLNSHWGFDINNKKLWERVKPDAVNLANSRGICIVGPPPAAFPVYRENWLPSWYSLNRIMEISGAKEPHKGLHELGVATSTKLVHKGFTPITTPPTAPLDTQSVPSNASDISVGETPALSETVLSVTHALEPELAAPFTMAHWHLPAGCEHLRAALLQTHKPVPLNAVLYGSDDPILPVNYEVSLRGAIVEARFSLRYTTLRREEGPVSWFTATIEELVVLELPTVMLPSPLQARSRSRFFKKNDKKGDKNPDAGSSTSTRTKRAAPGPATPTPAKRTRSSS